MTITKPNRITSMLATRAEQGRIHATHLFDLVVRSIQLKVDEAIRERPKLNNFSAGNADELLRLINQKRSCTDVFGHISDCIASQKVYADRIVTAGIDATIGFLVECWGDVWVLDEIMRRELPASEKSSSLPGSRKKNTSLVGLGQENVRIVAQQIRVQLGGRRFTAMTGAKNFGCGTDEKTERPYLSFQLPQRAAKSNIWCVRIIYTEMDLYDIEYISSKRERNGFGTYTLHPEVVAKTTGIYADQLRHDFEDKTGLALALGTVHESSCFDEPQEDVEPEVSV